MQKFSINSVMAIFAFFVLTFPALAAPEKALDGSHISILFIIPFCCLLLSIAIAPLLFSSFWHHHYGKISALWAVILLIPLALIFSKNIVFYEIIHIILVDYIPFVAILFALFTVTAGIRLEGTLPSGPQANILLLGIGAGLASVIGTTGASMVLIRPLLHTNAHRRYQAHTVVFFIFLVSNIGGSLTPLGDPPLFLGFLRGVDFFWTAQHLGLETLFLVLILLSAFYVLDRSLYAYENSAASVKKHPAPHAPLRITGQRNIFLLAAVIGAIFMSAYWKPNVSFTLYGTTIGLQNSVRDGILLLCGALSLLITPRHIHRANRFSWAPFKEVALLFAAIFICIIPVIAILKAGENGALAPLVALTAQADGSPSPFMYFWLTGLLSAFLDNAPTYLVFFNLAGGNPEILMTSLAPVLKAISGGAVFMGALTYIGNAPNFMVKAIAEDQGVKMPSFFGYMAWSFGFLIPCFTVLSWLFYS